MIQRCSFYLEQSLHWARFAAAGCYKRWPCKLCWQRMTAPGWKAPLRERDKHTHTSQTAQAQKDKQFPTNYFFMKTVQCAKKNPKCANMTQNKSAAEEKDGDSNKHWHEIATDYVEIKTLCSLKSGSSGGVCVCVRVHLCPGQAVSPGSPWWWE